MASKKITKPGAMDLQGLKKGALHQEMGIPQGQKIPENRLKKAENSSSPTLRKRAQFADNAKKWGSK